VSPARLRVLLLAGVSALAMGLRGVAQTLDCNGNGRPDAAELSAGDSVDRNSNSIPDECEQIPIRFGAPANLDEGGMSPRSFAVGDFTGDGRLDIVRAWPPRRTGAPSIQISIGQGQRRFESTRSKASGSSARVAAGDVDGDGDLDLVAAHSGNVWVLANDGNGNLTQATALQGVSSVSGLAVGDLTRDGKADVIVTDRSEDAMIVFAASESGFETRRATGAYAGALGLFDADGDGDLDVAAAMRTPASLLLLENRGTSLVPGSRIEAPGPAVEQIVTGDWDGDGKLELAMALATEVLFLRSAPGGRLSAAGRFVPPRLGLPIRVAVAGDPDGDGDTDLALGLGSGYGAVIAQNSGAGLFNGSMRCESPEPIVAIDLRDLDGDGYDDLLSAPTGTGGLRIHWNETEAPVHHDEGRLTMASESLPVGFEPHSCSLADMDRDGTLDLAAIDGETNVNILRNPGDGHFSRPRSYDVHDALEMISLIAQDLDGDGDPDVATADESTNNVLVLANQGRGDLRQVGSYSVGEHPMHLSAGDLVGDGVPDLLCVDNQDETLSVLLGKGKCQYRAARSLRVGSHPFAAGSGDIDQDGRRDIVLAGYGSSEVIVLFGDERGAFNRRRSYPVRWPTFVAVGDLDGDGRDDVAATSYGTQQVALLWNNGQGELELGQPLAVQEPPFTMLRADVDGDKLPDLITANTNGRSVAIFLNEGGRRFAGAQRYRVGWDPRFVLAGDLDGDGDVDVVSANHSSLDMTLLFNKSSHVVHAAYLPRIATEAEFFQISQGATEQGAPSRRGVRQTKFVIRASPGDSTLLPAVFQDVKVQPLHQVFLAEAFPDRFPALDAATYDALTGRRATRKYWSGVLTRFRDPGGPIYGFNLLGAFGDDARELPTPQEVHEAFDTLAEAFLLRPLVYSPEAGPARDDAARWKDPGFPVRRETAASAERSTSPTEAASDAESLRAQDIEAYTAGVAFGRVRVLTEQAFAQLNERGGLSYQDILVLERAPRDIEGVVSGVVTAEKQGELSHLALRTARRGTPNAYVKSALSLHAPFDGKLARLEVQADGVTLTLATAQEVAAASRTRGGRTVAIPEPELTYGALDSLDEMILDGPVPPPARYGGKASNFARLQRILGTPFDRYRERGFAIPVRYYAEFLRSSRVTSAMDPSRQVSAAEWLHEIEDWPVFQADSELRFAALQHFREELETAGEVDGGLAVRIARRIEEVFGSSRVTVRLRSSSNIEDALEFNGAGLYSSTSACAADELDGDDLGPSECDAARPAERDLTRALRKVWASLWSFRAYEERAYYGLHQESSAMGMLVSEAYQDEKANGVAMTGNPQSPWDRRYVVTAQAGEASVVSPDPGVLAERTVLDVSGGVVSNIIRAQPSTLVPKDAQVLSDGELDELGLLLEHVDRSLPVELEGRRRADVLLDLEFKFDADGCLALKQVRTFLRQDADEPAPIFALDVPEGAETCGSFVPSREPVRAWELKCAVQFRPGRYALPAADEAFELDLIEAVHFGPEAEAVLARGPGRVEVRRVPLESGSGRMLSYTQTFARASGDDLALRLGLELSDPPPGLSPPPIRLDERIAERKLQLHARVGGTVTFAPCGEERLPLWSTFIETDGGLRFRLLERHEPPATRNDTGPAALVEAELSLGEEARTVDSYWDLVYTSLRHNRAVRYWVMLDPPLEAPEWSAPARAIEIVAPEPKLGVPASVRFLADDHSTLETQSVSAWQRRRSMPAEPAWGRRGDADGDGTLSLADVHAILRASVFCEPAGDCIELLDADADGGAGPTDAVAVVRGIFGELGAPGAGCVPIDLSAAACARAWPCR